MKWFRKFIVLILAILLFVTIIAATFATSLTITASNPKNVEQFLAKSGIYGNLVNEGIKQSTKNSENSSGNVSLNDAQVQQIARQVFSAKVAQQSVETIINANYSWLQGKSQTPQFRVDLTAQKLTFANNVSVAVKKHLVALPACNPAQVAQIQANSNVSLLTLDCRPPNVNPEVEAIRVKQQLINDDFLNDPVITASNLSSGGDSNKQSPPYYSQYAKTPSIYKSAQRSPIALAVLALLLAILIFFISLTHRKGLRVICYIFINCGLLLLLQRFYYNTPFLTSVGVNIHNAHGQVLSPIQKSGITFINLFGDHMAQINMYIGFGLILIAAIILVAQRRSKNNLPTTAAPKTTVTQPEPALNNPIDYEEPPVPKPQTAPKMTPTKKPVKPKRPRLIQ